MIEGAGPVSSSRMRRGSGAPVKRAGIGAQPLDQTNSRRDHQLGSYRHVVENIAGVPTVTLNRGKRK